MSACVCAHMCVWIKKKKKSVLDWQSEENLPVFSLIIIFLKNKERKSKDKSSF